MAEEEMMCEISPTSTAVSPENLWSWIAGLFLAIAAAAFFTFELNSRSLQAELVALVMACVVAVGGMALRCHVRTELAILLLRIAAWGSVLVIAIACWNLAFMHYVAQPGVDVSRGEFRVPRQSRHWPMYCRFEFDGVGRGAPAAAAVISLVGYLIYAEIRKVRAGAGFLWTAVALQICAMLAFGYSEDRLKKPIQYDYFRYGLTYFRNSGVADLLRRYVRMQPRLGTFNSHYPPGYMLLMFVEGHAHLSGVVCAAAIILTAMAIFPIASLTAELGGTPETQRWAVALFCTTTGVLVYPTITPITLSAFLAIAAMLFWVRSRNAVTLRTICLFGLSTTAFALLSFSVGMLGLLFVVSAVFMLRAERRSFLAMAVTAVGGGAIFLITCFLLRKMFHFSWFDCLHQSMLRLSLSNGKFLDTPFRFGLKVSGNILIYLLSCGFVTAVPALLSLRWVLDGRNAADANMHPWAKAFCASIPLTIVIASFLGMGRFENERVWLFMTPMMVIAAAFWLRAYSKERNTLVFTALIAAAGLWAFAQEILFRHR